MPKNLLSSLRVRLLFLLMLIIVPVFGLLLHNALEARKQETLHMQSVALRLARLILLEQRELIAGARQLLPGLAQLPSVRVPDAGPVCNREFANLLVQYPYYANFGVSGRDGLMRCSGLPMPTPVRIEDRDYFRRAMETGDFAIGGYQVGRITGKSAINFGYPLRDDHGRVDGVVFAALDLAWLSRKLTDIPLPQGTTITILDGNGTVLAHQPDPEKWFGKTIRNTPFVRMILERGMEGTDESIDPEGIHRLYAFTPLHQAGSDSAYVSVGIPRDVAYADLDARFKRDLLLLFLIVVVVTTVAWKGSNTFVLHPLRILARTSERLGNGDLSARTALQRTQDEFGQLAQSFDQMAVSLQRQRDEAETHDKELQRTNLALRTLSAGNRTLVRAADESSLLQKMCSVAVELGGYRMAWVGFAEHDAEKTVRPVAQAGTDKAFLDTLHITWDETEQGNGPTGTAIRTGRHCVAHGLQSDPRYQAWHTAAREQGIESALSLPLQVDQEVMGAITIYAEDDGAFDAAEIELLSEMAEDLAYGIATLRTRIKHDAAQATIQRMAYFDALTGLPNHASLEEHLDDAITGVHSRNHSLALLLFDLERLRDINDTLGFEAGNKVMQVSAQRIAQETEKGEFVARMRGDEFALLLPESDADHAEQTVLRILALLNQPFSVNDFSLVVRANVGIVLFPEHGTDGEQIIRRANLAMQLAKLSGNGYAFYSPEQDVDKKRHLALASDLNRALQDNALELYYQPKISMRSGHVNGFEALARWSHPTHGMIPPDEFIALAERTGMIRAITDWVLASALRQLTTLRQAGIHLPIAVNLSAINLQDPRLLDKIQEMCAACNMEKGMLELEITESAVMADPVGALEILSRLSDLGMPLYIDDFGTGYSSLSYLKKLPVATIKIDRSFVADMLDDADSASIVRSTITLAHDMALTVVAEGVEDEAVWAQLKALGCDAGQGYYMGRPMPASEVERWLHESPWGLAGASLDK
ncbi:bifunctional diguanylate cyclase/phosphodiesterase [Sedimenticola selenatireducens]|uniref:cyclic-guanylate-specific phosphodiesterase n=3 Tax=Sedimenticola TaxID=349742 RepID=A0A558CX85_9GAMM|nr:EAL domain-containing protein [Sedimenticola selenatireducens]TVO69707.1 EAL domain-containing protein [Sedimenticola selenatireducens]TVT53387.1 MAG: EAL domain-containing protein [Sedimenticola thiotaurini]TVT62225.1 MAG: EAL domain-containing protein [Sedimenticola selenatireducens]